MTADEFATRLMEVRPTRAQLDIAGISSTSVNWLMDTFECTKRLTQASNIVDSDEAVAFVNHWDATRVKIGAVNFCGEAFASTIGVQIGEVEVDPLVVKADSGEVAVFELGTPDHVLWYTAENGAKLLDALIVAAAFFVKRVIGDISYEAFDIATATAKQCSTAAGGPKYNAFYSMLLGAEP